MTARGFTFVTKTLGCKVNQVDSAAIRRDLIASGFREAERERADVVIVNSCTVTAGADRDARKTISWGREGHPNALVVLTGCLSPDGRSGQERADLVFGNDGKERLVDAILEKLTGRAGLTETAPVAEFFGAGVIDHAGKTRAFLKVQDGCNRHCSYCVIPSVRGTSRSRSIDSVVDDARSIEDQGFRELVLTGVHLGGFGADARPRKRLSDLVSAILYRTSIPRIRISSVEPMEIKEDLIALAAGNPRVCRHWHIPLQSGDDEMLAAMRRPYTTRRYAELMDRIHASTPDVLVGADVIVGFPGETDEAFERTLRFVESVGVDHFHVFPYSERPGTHAQTLSGRIPVAAIKDRSARLRAVAKTKWRTFLMGQRGKVVSVLIVRQREDGFVDGLSDNYLPVRVIGRFALGSECRVRLNELVITPTGPVLRGTPLPLVVPVG